MSWKTGDQLCNSDRYMSIFCHGFSLEGSSYVEQISIQKRKSLLRDQKVVDIIIQEMIFPIMNPKLG